ncbi:MAG: STAS domain-containing protein [Desulfuromonadaceae bacterium]|nr:STAS domain-containing protein [Desulfuromonadaceae bacterium]
MSCNCSVREDGQMVITSGDRLTIECAAEFSRCISEAFEASQVVAVEFDPAVEIDITGVQVLCSACKSAAQSGKKFSYHGPQPQALTDIIASSGAERNAACKHNNDSLCIWFGGSNSWQN